MNTRKIIVYTLIALITATCLVSPSHAQETFIQTLCDPWKYQESKYEYLLGDTYIIDIYIRKCDDRIETKKDYQLLIKGSRYTEFLIKQMIHNIIPIPYHNLIHDFAAIIHYFPKLQLKFLLGHTHRINRNSAIPPFN